MEAKVRLVIVESKGLQADFIESAFDADRYNIIKINNGRDAFKYLSGAEDQSGVIILSYHLPDMNGLEIMQKIREQGNELAFIFLTADKTVETAVEAMKAGAFDFIPKSSELHKNLPGMVEKVNELQNTRLEQKRMKEQLHENREMLRSTLDSMEDIVMTINSKGVIVDVHRPDSFQIEDFSESNLTSQHYKQVGLQGAFSEKLESSIQSLILSGKAQQFELHYTTTSVSLWISVTVTGRQSMDFDFNGVTVVIRNTTQQKKAEQVLRDSEKRLKTIMDSVQAGILLINPQTLKIREANPLACQMIQADENDVLTKKVNDFLSFTIDSESIDNDVFFIQNQETKLKTRLHTEIDVLYTIKQIELNSNRYLLVSFVDISEQKHISQQLIIQNAEIQQKNAEIEAQRDQLEDQRDSLILQRDEIMKQKEEITDSIRYAQRIQNAIFPPREFMKYLLPEHFILYQPKDIVSGDFYWFNQQGNRLFIAAADSTGHGVPGAFMSLLGATFLNEIAANAKGQINAAKTINLLRDKIIKSLRQTGKRGEAQDGIDMALCIIDTQEQTMDFAGANNPLNVIRYTSEIREVPRDATIRIKDDKRILYEFRPDKMPVGFLKRKDKSFTNYRFKICESDKFYISSDGYADQFGGEKGRKFYARRQKELLFDIADKPFDEQCKILEDEINAWKGSHPQIDDMLIIGFMPVFKVKEFSTGVSNWSHKTILLVEDEKDNADLILEILSDTEAKVIWVDNGKKAVEACFLKPEIDLVLMDIRMPKMNGYEATQLIKASKPTLPIIVQTAFTMDGEKEKSFKAGCDDYITKPIQYKEVLATLSKYLG